MPIHPYLIKTPPDKDCQNLPPPNDVLKYYSCVFGPRKSAVQYHIQVSSARETSNDFFVNYLKFNLVLKSYYSMFVENILQIDITVLFKHLHICSPARQLSSPSLSRCPIFSYGLCVISTLTNFSSVIW